MKMKGFLTDYILISRVPDYPSGLAVLYLLCPLWPHSHHDLHCVPKKHIIIIIIITALRVNLGTQTLYIHWTFVCLC